MPDRVSFMSGVISLVGIMFFFFDSLSAGGMIGNILALISGFFYAVVFLIKQIPEADFESSALISFALNFVIGIPFYMQETNWGMINLTTGLLRESCRLVWHTYFSIWHWTRCRRWEHHLSP